MDMMLQFPLGPAGAADASGYAAIRKPNARAQAPSLPKGGPPTQSRVAKSAPSLPKVRSTTPEESMSRFKNQGWLTKKSKHMQGSKANKWKKYYFVIDTEQKLLRYYKNDTVIDRRPLEVIDLSMSTVLGVDQTLFDIANVFQMRISMMNGDTKPAYLGCDNQEEVEHWVLSLRALCSNAKPTKSVIREIRSLQLTVCDAKGIPSKIVNPMCYVELNGARTAKTKATTNKKPFWMEAYKFDDLGTEFESFSVILCNKDKYKGYGEILVERSHLNVNQSQDKWYTLSSDPSVSVRLKFTYTVESVLPEFEYDAMRSVLVRAVSERNFKVFDIFNELCKDAAEKTSVSRSLCKLFHFSEHSAPSFLGLLNDNEIMGCEDPNTIFRGNSLASKAMDQYMKMIAIPYLHRSIMDIVHAVFDMSTAMELDVMKMDMKLKDSDKSVLKAQNKERLVDALRQLWGKIQTSADDCPVELRVIFNNLQNTVNRKKQEVAADSMWKNNNHVKYSAVSGFIFLRLFMPAIMGPKLFNMMPDHPSDIIDRNLKLMAKCMQNLANLAEFGGKEPYMMEINPFIKEQIPAMRNFLDTLATAPTVKQHTKATDTVYLARELQSIYVFVLSKAADFNAKIGELNDPLANEFKDTINALRRRHTEFEDRGEDMYLSMSDLKV